MAISKIIKICVAMIILSGSSASADLFGPQPIVGHCTSDSSTFDDLIAKNGYKLKQTSAARDGRTVMLYLAEDFMIAVADEERSKWCIQFTSYDAEEFVEFLVGRYDPTTRGDEDVD